jgi:peptidoglycan/xylan/chitin deacetylase (PgdA/CDA1 family)
LTSTAESEQRRPAEPRVANISIDFESVYYYSVTLGLKHPDRDRDYDRIVDRFLELFAELDVPATFFLVGDDIRAGKLTRPMLRRMVAAGHELANHTLTHPHNLSTLSPDAKEHEVSCTGKLIEDATGQRVVGFRAPCLDIDEVMVDIIERLGYTYESSVLPFYLKQVQEFTYGLLCHGRFRSTGSWQNSFAPGDPYVPAQGRLHARGSRKITEVPIATLPIVRVPFYSTIHFAFGRRSFDASYTLLRRRRAFTYELHSIDLAGRDDHDVVDRYPGIDRHPCLRYTVAENREFLRYAIRRFKQDYRLATLRDLVAEVGPDASLLSAR